MKSALPRPGLRVPLAARLALAALAWGTLLLLEGPLFIGNTLAAALGVVTPSAPAAPSPPSSGSWRRACRWA